MLKILGTFSSNFVKNCCSTINNVVPQVNKFSTCKLLTPTVFKQLANTNSTYSSQYASMKPLLSVDSQNVNSTRNVTKFSLKTGKKKSVGAVLRRFYRLNNGLWIRRRAGCHKHLWKKTGKDRYNFQQHVVCTKTQCLMLDRMITDHWKKRKYYIDDPFEPYHTRNDFDYVYPYKPLK